MNKLSQIIYPDLILIQSQGNLTPKSYGTRMTTELIL